MLSPQLNGIKKRRLSPEADSNLATFDTDTEYMSPQVETNLSPSDTDNEPVNSDADDEAMDSDGDNDAMEPDTDNEIVARDILDEAMEADAYYEAMDDDTNLSSDDGNDMDENYYNQDFTQADPATLTPIQRRIANEFHKINDAKLLQPVDGNVDYDEEPERFDDDYLTLVDQEDGLVIRIEQLLEEVAIITNFPGDSIDMVLTDEEDDYLPRDEAALARHFDAPEWSIPIKANVMTFDWLSLGKEIQFDVIMADPPWQLATNAPTRGVAIAYQQLPDICIEDIPIDKLQTNGFIFIWVINNKYAKAFEMMEKWGYHYVDDVTWVKQTINRRMAKGHGYYLQHAKETCLVGMKGTLPPRCRRNVASDVIFAERRGQSQKPEEIYEIIENLMPGGKYLEIFGRKNNLRDYWVTVGNEL